MRNPFISEGYSEIKLANFEWYKEGKPNIDHPTLTERKTFRQQFRSVYRTEILITN